MAAVRYFPSIHDDTTENMKIWAPFDPKPKQLNSQNISSTSDSSDKDCKTGADQNSSTSQQVEAKAAWKTLSEYRPLDVFSVTAEDPGSASWSEAEEICELYIRLKEIELCNMIGETSGIPECK